MSSIYSAKIRKLNNFANYAGKGPYATLFRLKDGGWLGHQREAVPKT